MPKNDIFKKPARPKLDAYKNLADQDSEQNAQELHTPSTVDSRLNCLQLVPIERLTSSQFQGRDELNITEDREYQQLRTQVEADLTLQPDNEPRTIEHVFVVMPNPKNDEELILASGGHRRLKVCLDLGVKEVFVWIKKYDVATLATGTYKENKGRKKTNWLEDARTFKDIMETLGWTQSDLAQYLHVEGGQPHISRCLAMLDYHPDLQRMLALSEERGMRAAKELARLEKHIGIEKARELWAPLITGFLNGELFTDDIEQKVKGLIGGEPEKQIKADTTEFPELRLKTQAVSVRKKWHSFRKEIGDGPLSPDLKAEIEAVYQEMGEILARSM
jgi:ParB/RepB/Spo0J family partition protein